MLAARLVKWTCKGQYSAFIETLKDPFSAQRKLRAELAQGRLWSAIPISTYQDLEPILPAAEYVETSGSSLRSKKIPYTKGLKGSFVNLFKIWAYDLLTHHLQPPFGKVFLSVSPPSHTGEKDDSRYLSPWLRWVLKPYLYLPATDPEGYMERVAQGLWDARDVSVISIWNPTYLHQILDALEKLKGKPLDWQKQWPKLQLISCWCDGWAAPQAQELRKRLPHVHMQGKGLLATEAPLTVPLCQAPAPVPLVSEVFFEFEDGSGSVCTLDGVVDGKLYEVIISQKGGLLRYRLGDIVRVEGRFYNTPCLRFIGRKNTCDMVGEKLDGIVVEELLDRQIAGPWLLLPVYAAQHPCRYLLLTEKPAEGIEKALQQIYHYKAARLTGQLDAVEVRVAAEITAKLHRFYQQRGMNWGDIKGTRFIADPLIAAQFIRDLAEQPMG